MTVCLDFFTFIVVTDIDSADRKWFLDVIKRKYVFVVGFESHLQGETFFSRDWAENLVHGTTTTKWSVKFKWMCRISGTAFPGQKTGDEEITKESLNAEK